MKNLKFSFSVLAVVLGLGSAVATSHHLSGNKKWGRDASGQYTEITGQSQGTDYLCTSSSAVCTAEYPEAVDPNDQAHDSYPGTAQPQNVVNGLFAQ